MVVTYRMRVVLVRILLVQPTAIPITHFGLALRPPMCPNPKLGIAKPFRNLVLLKRLPGRLKLPFGNRFCFCIYLNNFCCLGKNVLAKTYQKKTKPYKPFHENILQIKPALFKKLPETDFKHLHSCSPSLLQEK